MAALLSAPSAHAIAQAPEAAYSARIESSETLPDGIEERLAETALTYRLKDNPPPTRAGSTAAPKATSTAWSA